MEFTIKDETETEDNIELWLEREDSDISLMGRNKDGTKETIMRFEDGSFRRNYGTGLKGLKTDEEGRIEEEK